jgi:hypothetical protein
MTSVIGPTEKIHCGPERLHPYTVERVTVPLATREAPMTSLLFLLVGLSMLFPVTAPAQSTLPVAQLGLVGLARGETARLHVVNFLPPDPCHVAMQFLDEQGEVFPGAVAEVDLGVGQATHLDLPATTAFGNGTASTALRRRFRATVEVSTGPSTNLPPGPCRGIVTTLELFDNLTGRLVAFIPPGPPNDPGSTEPPGPPGTFGMVGLARLQSLVLTTLNLTPAAVGAFAPPCRVSLAFLDETGQVFSSGKTPVEREVDLAPGEFATLTLPAALALAGSQDLRRAFRATVAEPPGPPIVPPDPCDGLVNTLELVDTLTGRTQLIYPAGANPGPPETNPGSPD